MHDSSPDRTMRALVIESPGDAGRLMVMERSAPAPAHGEVLVRVKAAGVNRADVLQRRGRYPAPPDAPADVPGLEFAGEVVRLGADARGWRTGDRVMGITGGGAQAELIAVPASHLIAIPPALDWIAAAAVPEAFITAHDALVTQGMLAPGEHVLVHAVGSGVGLAAVQIVRALGAHAWGTTRSAPKLEAARALGMEDGIVVGEDLAAIAELAARVPGRPGFDVVLDLVGGAYVEASVREMAQRGRLLLVGTVAGARAAIPLGLVLSKRLTLRGTVLRARSVEEKAEATARFAGQLLPLLADGRVVPAVDRVFPLDEAAAAYEHVERDRAVGKVVLSLMNES